MVAVCVMSGEMMWILENMESWEKERSDMMTGGPNGI